MESQEIAADAIVLQSRLPECRAVRGIVYGTVCTRHDGTYRYFRIGKKTQWYLARESPDCGTDREVMQSIRAESDWQRHHAT